MSRGLLDTSVIIAQLESPSLDALRPDALPDEAAISVATLAELHYGVLAAKTEEIRRLRLQRLGEVEATFQPLPIDAAVARAFARVAHTVKMAGRQPRARVMDLWIAATALAHAIPLYTHNRDDFLPLRQLIEVKPVGE
ncbi:MAG TPA: type II toxin-antitoxin system VapC family toxin [Thermoanaerobaculia bacterium]